MQAPLRSLEAQLDAAVEQEVNIKLSRAGEVMNIQLRVGNFHKLRPNMICMYTINSINM